MKRLPFALVALAFSIPAVACLNNASDDSASSSSNDLTELPQGTRDACSFKFTEVEKAVGQNGDKLELGPVGLKTSGQRLLWGDYNGDGIKDFMVSAPAVGDDASPADERVGANRVRVYLAGKDKVTGKFTGKFSKTKVKDLAKIADRKNMGVALLASGDFNGDKMDDAIVLRTTVAADGSDQRDDIHVLYGNDKGSSNESAVTNAQVLLPLTPVTGDTYYHAAGDLDGDGKADFVFTTLKGETVAFGDDNADNKVLVAKDLGLPHDVTRSLAFINKKEGDKTATLYIATAGDKDNGIAATLKTITFDKDRNPTVASQDVAFPEEQKSSRWIGSSFALTSPGDIAIAADKGLGILPVAPTEARGTNTYGGFPGVLIGGADFNGDKVNELLYAKTATELYAACGVGMNADKIVATPIKNIPFSEKISLAGYVDIDNDGQADLVTLDTSGDATKGTLRLFLGAGKEDAPSPLEEFAALSSTPSTDDAGTDTGTTTEVDSGADTGTTTEVDSGADTGTTEVDSGVDAGVDSGTVKPPKPDAGKAQPTGDDDDDDGSSEGAPDGEGSGTKTDKPNKNPAAKPTGGATVTTIPKPMTTDDGCSTAPGSHGVSSSAFGGLFAAMMLLVRRRRNKRA